MRCLVASTDGWHAHAWRSHPEAGRERSQRERERERGASVLLCAAARQGATRGAGDTIASTRGCPECLQAGRLHGSAIPRAAGGRLSSDVVESEHRAAAPRRRPRGWLTGSRRLVFTRSYVRRRVRVEIYDGPRTGITPARRIVWAAGTLVQAATGATARPPRSGARRASGATGRRASVDRTVGHVARARSSGSGAYCLRLHPDRAPERKRNPALLKLWCCALPLPSCSDPSVRGD